MNFLKLDYKNPEDLKSLSTFINENKQNQNTFRYFNSRSFEIIKNHLVTFLLMENEKCVGYGHLDKEGNDIWLGVMVDHKQRGKGYGKMITEKLIEHYNGKIVLSVDKPNEIAIKIYKSLGFKLFKENDAVFFMVKEGNTSHK